MSEYCLTEEERLILSLRSLWMEKGYRTERVKCAEEYDFYSRNKEFLSSGGVITFTDGDGKLMALKSDVTLSLIRKMRDTESGVRRVMYNEKIYRIPPFSSSFCEIEQTGLECMGPLGEDEIVEVVLLAYSSLEKTGENVFLTLSHMGIIEALLSPFDEESRDRVILLLKKRKTDEIRRMGDEEKRIAFSCRILSLLLENDSSPETVLSILSESGIEREALDELEAVMSALEGRNVVFDFSSLGAFGYYNGIIMKGYVENFTRPVLQGGEYSLLLRRMKRNIERGIGFAIYLDEYGEVKRC